jgi:hypothetical protein
MKLVISLLDKGTEFVEKISDMGTGVYGKIWREVCGGSTGHDFFKGNQLSSDFSCNSLCAEEAWMSLPPHPLHITASTHTIL